MPKLVVQLFQIGQELRQFCRVGQRMHATQVYPSLPVGVSLVANLFVAFFVNAPSGRYELLKLFEIRTHRRFHVLHQVAYNFFGVRIFSFFAPYQRSFRENP
jgi:hypothetical protein